MLSGPFLASRGRKKGQKWNFDTQKCAHSIPYRKLPIWPYFHGLWTILSFSAIFWPLEAIKGARSGILTKKCAHSIPYRKLPIWSYFHGLCTILSFSAIFWPLEAIKGARSGILTKIFYMVCSLDPKEHPDQISNFFFVRCARKRSHNVWTNVVFNFRISKLEYSHFFSISSKTKWSSAFYIPKLYNKPKMSNKFL